MLPATDDERAYVTGYYLSQSAGAKVNFLQKIYTEAVIGHEHAVWDVHASDGRWWVITNPTNLYSQDQFPNMDLAMTFHMGLCLRIPRNQEQEQPAFNIGPFAELIAYMSATEAALGQAQNVTDYQTMGVRCREALLLFIGAAQDTCEWVKDAAPKRADFKAWIEIICNTALAGQSQKARRRLFKSLLTEAWEFANWLTHSQSSTWHDAEAAQSNVAHVLGLMTSLLLRHIRDVPETCPDCGSPHLHPDEGWRADMPDIVWERPVCADCGWTGQPHPTGEREPMPKNCEVFIRAGREMEEFVLAAVPLTHLKKPGG